MFVFLLMQLCLTVLFSTSVSSRNTCGNLQMNKAISTQDEFDRKLRKTFRRSSSRLECSRLCYEDDRCNGILVCPGVCYVFGVFSVDVPPDPDTDHNNCDVFNLNQCGNKGFPDDNGYCRCTRGHGGPFCETVIHDSCYSQWRLVLDSETPQSLPTFPPPAESLCGTKAKFITYGTKSHTVDSIVTDANSNSLQAQTTYALTKSSWNAFEFNPKRIFKHTVNGENQIVATFNIDGSLVSMSTPTITGKLYAKEFTDGRPRYETNATGSLISSDFDMLLSKIKDGSTVPYLRTLFVSADEDEIAGGGITKLDRTPNNVIYWDLHRFFNSGLNHFLFWKVGEGSLVSRKSEQMKNTWCTDDCWIRMFAGDQYGKRLHGSTTGLARALLSGHQLRVNTGGVAAIARAIYIHGQTISACLEDMMEPIGVTNFDSSGTAQRKIVSSNGQIQTRRYTFETDSILEELQEQQDTDWFVDTREWIQVLSVTGDRQTLSGSVADLREKVLVGASVRIVVEFTDGMCQIVDADHLEVSSAGHVAAEIIYHANTQFGENYNITFTASSSHHLWSAIITTEGDFNKYLYTYKRNDGQPVTLSTIDRYTWFVQM